MADDASTDALSDPRARAPSERTEPPSVLAEIGQTRPFEHAGEELVVSILRTSDEARRYIAGVLAGEDLTAQQYNVLRILRGAGEGGLATLAIAERMIERTPGVTRLVDRLVRKGLVARTRDVEDRRRIVCTITSEGEAMLDRIRPRLDAATAAFEASLASETLPELARGLDAMRQALREATPDAEGL